MQCSDRLNRILFENHSQEGFFGSVPTESTFQEIQLLLSHLLDFSDIPTKFRNQLVYPSGDGLRHRCTIDTHNGLTVGPNHGYFSRHLAGYGLHFTTRDLVAHAVVTLCDALDSSQPTRDEIGHYLDGFNPSKLRKSINNLSHPLAESSLREL